eukprot:5094179-Amphidinium_carterae.1
MFHKSRLFRGCDKLANELALFKPEYVVFMLHGDGQGTGCIANDPDGGSADSSESYNLRESWSCVAKVFEDH